MQSNMFKFSCDAPGCGVSVIVEAPSIVGVSDWGQIEIDGKELAGCCEMHLAAAVLASIGMMPAAQLLMMAYRNVKLPEEYNPNRQEEVAK